MSAEPVRPVDGTVDPADSVEKEHKDDEILTETKVGNSTVSSTNERKEKTRYAEYETYFEEKFDPFNSGTENWEWGEDENAEGDFPSIFDHEEIDEYDDWDSPDERCSLPLPVHLCPIMNTQISEMSGSGKRRLLAVRLFCSPLPSPGQKNWSCLTR